MADYLRAPEDIYRRSFEIVQAETDLDGFADDAAGVAVRLVHACAMPDIAGDLRFSPGAVAAGRRALGEGAPILVDARMVADGITPALLPAANPIICTLNDAAVPARAAKRGMTRSAVAVELWREHLDGAVVAIGNAPTALFRLLELLDEGAPRPALVVGFPVGFVGAADSKEALSRNRAGVPFMTLLGRRGGSALAAAAVNALGGDVP